MGSMATSRSAEIHFPEEGPSSVALVISELVDRHPELARWIYREPGVLRPGVNVFVDKKNTRFLDGLETPIAPGQEVWIVTPQSGG